MDEAISQFISITGSDANKAKFYVESANGDVQEAVSTFFEADGGEDDVTATGVESASVAPSGPRTLSGAPADPLPEGWGSKAGSSSSRVGGGSSSGNKSGAKSSGSGGGGATSRFASLSDFRSGGPGDDDDDDEEDDAPRDGRDPAHFFTGGERSGLSVQNPDHGRRGGAPNVVQDILQRARQMAERRAAGEKVDDEDDEDWGEGGPTQGNTKPPSNFAGQGRTLNEASSTSEAAESGTAAVGTTAGSSNMPGGFQLAGEGARDEEENDDGSAVANRRIIFWQDGFSLEDGPLCRYDDPAHAHTLAMINQGAAPLSFLNVRFGQRVNLTVEQKHEKYTPPPPPPMKPFGGHGNRLGSPATSLGTSSPSASASASTSQPAPAAPSNFEVDTTKPTTQLQIRLADGQRLVGRFNLTHTVNDVRGYINAGHPGMSDRQYVLQTSFPPKPISDEKQTLQEAGLANAVIIQKWN